MIQVNEITLFAFSPLVTFVQIVAASQQTILLSLMYLNSRLFELTAEFCDTSDPRGQFLRTRKMTPVRTDWNVGVTDVGHRNNVQCPSLFMLIITYTRRNYGKFFKWNIVKSIHSTNQGTSYLVQATLRQKSPVQVYLNFPLAYEYRKFEKKQNCLSNDVTVYVNK